jgi:hypothetical protein
MAFELPTGIRDEVEASLARAPRASTAARFAANPDVVDPRRSASAASEPARARDEGEESVETQAPAVNGVERETEAAEAPTSFEEIIAPLVAASGGKPITGPGLGWCRAAFAENPAAFALCAEHALRYGRPPTGRLCVMIRDGDHRLWARAADADARPSNGKPCPECGVGGGLHSAECPVRRQKPVA